MNRDVLERPFLAIEIKQRVGSKGTMIDYVEGHTVVARLNEAFKGAWSFEVRRFEVAEDRDEVMVLGKLVAEGITKNQFGSSPITRNKQTKSPVSIADDLKAAATDALKKCSTLFGVGLHLYKGKNLQAVQVDPVPQPPSRPAPPSNGHESLDRLSAKQHSYLRNLSRDHGLSRGDLDVLCQERFGVVFDNLNRAAASTLIEELSSQEPPPPQTLRSAVAKLQDSYI
jgi:hypothetical protein